MKLCECRELTDSRTFTGLYTYLFMPLDSDHRSHQLQPNLQLYRSEISQIVRSVETLGKDKEVKLDVTMVSLYSPPVIAGI